MPPLPLAACLAEKICGFVSTQVTVRAARQADACIADTLAVALAGGLEPCAQILLATPGIATTPGSSLIFGTARRTSALDAALVNATASHALDFDDVSSVFGGHPSAPVVAPLMALAEERALSGAAMLTAYVVGIEVETRLARAVHMHHYDKGWHPTATLGVFGAAAACAHLLRLTVPQTATALAMAVSLASGVKANFGTMAKPLQVGESARSGLMAALLAQGGYTAAPDAFEHPQGFFAVFNGAGHYDAEKALTGWGTPLEIEADTVALKRFPCCGSAQPAIVLALDLVRDERIQADEIAAVMIRVPRPGLRHTDRPDPATALDAKFSVQYAVARALVSGDVRLEHFEGKAHRDAAVRRLMAVTRAVLHPDMDQRGARHWGAEVAVTLKDGRTLTRAVDRATESGDALSDGERRAKFLMCAERVLPAIQAAALWDVLANLRTVDNVRAVTALLETPGPKK